MNSKILTTNENLFIWTQRAIEECAEYQVENLISHGKLCLDIGCNVGGFIIRNHNRFDNIIAYEASELNVQSCQMNLDMNGITNAVINRFAVGAEDGQILKLKKLNTSDNCGSFGTVDFVWDKGPYTGTGWEETEDSEEVPTISLDTILKDFDNVDFMKIDIEGAEYQFLINKDLSKIDIISMELHNFLIDLNQQKPLIEWISKTHNILTPINDSDISRHQILIAKRK
jgi:FkbM family methyltransferase